MVVAVGLQDRLREQRTPRFQSVAFDTQTGFCLPSLPPLWNGMSPLGNSVDLVGGIFKTRTIQQKQMIISTK